MTEAAWTDVRAKAPQILLAEDGTQDHRRVEARLLFYPLRGRIELECRLWHGGEYLETWRRQYQERSRAHAHATYYDFRERAGRWLDGARLEEIRPR